MNLVSLLSFASAVAFAALAIVGLVRARRGIAEWAFAAGMIVLAAERVCDGLSLEAATFGQVELWQERRLLVLTFLPAAWLLFSVTYARGNALTFVRKWSAILLAALVLPIGIAFGFRAGLIATMDSEVGHPWVFRLAWPGITLYTIVLITSMLVLMNLERTYRASVGTMRWRIKFMLLGLGVLAVVRIYAVSQALLFRGMDPRVESINSAAALVAMFAFAQALWRTREFDTDVYPSQSVLEGSLTALLAGLYLLGVGVFAQVAAYFGGDASFALKTFVLLVALVGLAILLQSDRVRLQVRRNISRHFERPVYEYRDVWQKFTEATASCVEQTELCRAIVKLTADVFQALSVSIWLVNDRKDSLALAASTSLSETKHLDSAPREEELQRVIAHFQKNPVPVDIETAPEDWAVALRRWHPSEFHQGGNRICAPLLRQNEIVGVFMVGDRVSGVTFPEQDMDMLKCIADQATASLLNVQLSVQLQQAKQLEAFQAMATFFVHDLKNAASTLNLMLQNLPVHFNDPEFRADALRGMAKTVTHINQLIRRLGLIRHELKIETTDSDLNELVTESLAGLETAAGTAIVKDLQVVPRLRLDRGQLQKVVTNLVLNATEAAPGRAEVRISTRHEEQWAVLTVADNGCGMSAEFLQRSLFRPFQTTKQNGLGIGMFQSRMIVEAHGGRIAVTSQPGQGTTFQVFIPIRGK